MKLWFAINAGGTLPHVWDKRFGTFITPGFATHDACARFWHKQEEPAWAIGVRDVVQLPEAEVAPTNEKEMAE